MERKLKILLVGDSCFDIYHYGEVKRISPEAPVPVFNEKMIVKKLGMAANVNENLKALGVQVDFFTEFLENKHRYIERKSNQQMLRVDEPLIEPVVIGDPKNISSFNEYDAIVISDYSKGFVGSVDYHMIRDVYDGPIFVDTKNKNLSLYRGAIIKVNQFEYEASDKPDEDIVVTYGGDQVIWHRKKPDAHQLFYPPKIDAHDVCGAGDTFLAALVVGYLENNNDMQKAVFFAMKAAAITVKHIGVYAPTREEIENGDKT